MSKPGSVSQLITEMKEGDAEALAALHRRYWPALVNIAQRKLRKTLVHGADEEDVAQSALVGFWQTVREGRAPQLENRHQLLALLTHIISCKAINQIKHVHTVKQGAGQVRTISPLEILQAGSAQGPDEQAILADCYRYYMDRLPEHLREFAELHLAGLTHHEIARRLGCVQRTIERKAALLRQRWQQIAEESLQEGG